jgi:nucleoside-diphosphate-sugar epimerase
MTGNRIILEDLKQIVASKVHWQRFSGKIMLVTGANGMLPSYMVETILYLCHHGIIENAKVLALVRNEAKAKQRFKDYLNDNNLEIIVHDVCLPLNIKCKIDFIVHAASQASPKYYIILPKIRTTG